MSLHRDKPKVDPVEQPQAAAALEPLEDGHEANVREDSLSTPDSRSQLSKRSNGSAISSAAARARAKSKAAQAQVTFAEREASVMRQKAELEASLHVLRSQKMAAAAAAAYEEEEIESGEKRYEPYVLGKPSTAYERAGDYVQQHSAMFGGEQSPPLHAQLDAYRPPPSTPAPLDFHRLPQRYAEAVVHTKPKPRVSNIKKEQPPPPLSSPNLGPSPEPQPAQDLARYLMRRELVSSGLLQFDDRPEHYWSWKASFLSVTQDLNLTSREEQARRLRSVHVLNPAAGLRMVWQRVEECYGTSEAVEHALLEKIEVLL